MTVSAPAAASAKSATRTAPLRYLSGFGNEHATEAVAGALPEGQNSPQTPPLGLYTEQISGTPFTAPRAANRRTWMYRIRPSAMHPPFRRLPDGLLRSAPFDEVDVPPNRLRWNPLPLPSAPTDFIDGLVTIAGNGELAAQTGIAIHVYRANQPMTERVFVDADGELLVVPQQGRLLLVTELGALEAAPGEIAVLPRGLRFRVELPDGAASGYVCENYGALLRLPELGPIGANALANPRDFLAPVAAYEDRAAPIQLVQKFAGHLWAADYDHSPLDVVAWHGNYAPYKYDLARFTVLGSVSFDHPDPSIYTVLTAPSDTVGMANVDFVIFPPRWMVAEHSFRPPWFHRNAMSEFMGMVRGVYDAKAEGFPPGAMSLHNAMVAHGPDAATFDKATRAELAPHYLADSLAVMFETRYVVRPTKFALECDALQPNYDACWQGFRKSFKGGQP